MNSLNRQSFTVLALFLATLLGACSQARIQQNEPPVVVPPPAAMKAVRLDASQAVLGQSVPVPSGGASASFSERQSTGLPDAAVSQEAWHQLERLAQGAEGVELVQKSSPAQQINESVYGRLIQHFNEWQGVSYRYGGQTKRGIDCSAFVQIAYAQRFKLSLPRTTELQRRQGRKVKRDQLKPGDMLFFKTGWRSYHNGIYLGEERFMHASSSKGVVMSNINEEYWRERFIEARRLLN